MGLNQDPRTINRILWVTTDERGRRNKVKTKPPIWMDKWIFQHPTSPPPHGKVPAMKNHLLDEFGDLINGGINPSTKLIEPSYRATDQIFPIQNPNGAIPNNARPLIIQLQRPSQSETIMSNTPNKTCISPQPPLKSKKGGNRIAPIYMDHRGTSRII